MRKIYRFLKVQIEYVKAILISPYYFFITRDKIWKIYHRKAIERYRKDRPTLTSLENQLVESLKNDGVAIVHISSLMSGGTGLLTQMQNSLENFPLKKDRRSLFLKHYFEEKDLQDLSSPFLRFALSENVLAVVSAYFNSCASLRHLGANMTLPEVILGNAEGSQRWHRDPGLFRFCKVFLYFNDILEESTGPFMYVKKSQPGGVYGHIYKQKLFGKIGVYPPDGSIEKNIPSGQITSCLGKAGTIIFCNTTGFHKGGYSTVSERKMLTAIYNYNFDDREPSKKYPVNFESGFANLGKLGQIAISNNNQIGSI